MPDYNSDRKNIILTGPPRSGTTLSCHLLNKLPNTIALHEPMNLKMFPDKETGLQNIDEFFSQMREQLLSNGTALSKVKDGGIPDNPFDNKQDGSRVSNVQKGIVRFEKKLTEDFHLIIKQNAHFTFLLDELKGKYPCYSIIRNPLSTILSWNSIPAPVSKGNLTVLKGINPWLFQFLASLPNLIERQVVLMDKIFRNYRHLPKENIIKYEDMISTKGKALSPVVEEANLFEEPLESRNQNKVYDHKLQEEIAAQLMMIEDAAYWDHYSESDILQMIS